MLRKVFCSAMHSYNHAIRLLEESHQPERAAGLCLEVAQALRKMDLEAPAQGGPRGRRNPRAGQALSFYQRAADLRSSTILEYMHAREKVTYRIFFCHDAVLQLQYLYMEKQQQTN